MANVIYGSEIAKQVKKDLRLRIMKLKNEQKRLPKLVVVLVGEHPASVSYVKGKEKACHEKMCIRDRYKDDSNRFD